MVSLNDYLYSGETILKILSRYSEDLRQSAIENQNKIDLVHCNFLQQQLDMLQHNEFLTSQSNRIREFYKYMAKEYPFLAFTFKGRIKSLIRAEAKYNGYIVEKIFKYHKENGKYPSVDELKNSLNCFRDFIAYRIVISMPACHLSNEKYREREEIHFLYKIANALPAFMENHGFTIEPSEIEGQEPSYLLNMENRMYYRDYVKNPSDQGYQSLHATFYDNSARCYIEVQLRTKEMDDYAEIGPANHFGYEKRQDGERSKRDAIPVGECIYFDEAYERVMKLQKLDLSKVRVNMFTAANNSLINDCCGLYRGRLILPFEHLSIMQNDRID